MLASRLVQRLLGLAGLPVAVVLALVAVDGQGDAAAERTFSWRVIARPVSSCAAMAAIW